MIKIIKSNLLFLLLFLLIFSFIYKNFFYQPKFDSQTIITKLEEIKRLDVLQAELFTYKSYEESSWMGIDINSFSVIETGRAVYGIDFDKNISLTIKGKTIYLKLPEVKLLDLVVNPDSIDFIGLNKGILTSQQYFEDLKKKVSIELFDQMKVKANSKENIEQAKKSAENILRSIFKTMNFDYINIEFQKTKIEN